MERLKKYLTKNGYAFKTYAATCDYFYNVPTRTFYIMRVYLGKRSADYTQSRAKIEKYCRRCGYETFNESSTYDVCYFDILPATERRALRAYNDAMYKCVEFVNNYIHRAKKNRQEVNSNTIRSIMDDDGAMFLCCGEWKAPEVTA